MDPPVNPKDKSETVLAEAEPPANLLQTETQGRILPSPVNSSVTELEVAPASAEGGGVVSAPANQIPAVVNDNLTQDAPSAEKEDTIPLSQMWGTVLVTNPLVSGVGDAVSVPVSATHDNLAAPVPHTKTEDQGELNTDLALDVDPNPVMAAINFVRIAQSANPLNDYVWELDGEALRHSPVVYAPGSEDHLNKSSRDMVTLR